MGRKYARIFVLGYYLFLEAHSFPRANCSPLETDNVQGQISEHIFAPNDDYCLFIMHQIVLLALNRSKCVRWLNMRQLKLGNVRVIFPKFQNCASEVKDNDLSLHLQLKLFFGQVLSNVSFVIPSWLLNL